MRWPWMLPALLAACFTDSPTPGAVCPPGADGCPCDAGSCMGELLCTEEGYCVDPSCGEGNLNCPCYGNGTCDAGLECVDGAVCHTIEGTGSAPTSASGSPSTSGPDPATESDDAATSVVTTGPVACVDCPTGHCDAMGRCARWIFVSEIAHPTNLGGIDGADELCNDEAMKAGLVRTFVAYLNDGTTSAPAHAEIDEAADVVFVMPTENAAVVVAASPAPFALGDGDLRLLHAIDHAASGLAAVPASNDCDEAGANDRVFTGYTKAVGGGVVAEKTCGGWDDTPSEGAGMGRFTEESTDWVAFGDGCDCRFSDGTDGGAANYFEAHLYCVELP